VLVFVLLSKKEREPGKASPVLLSRDANQNRSRQKIQKLTEYTRNGGVFSFGYFSLDKQRKVSRPSWDEKNTIFSEAKWE